MTVQRFSTDAEALLLMAEGDIDAYRFLFDKHFSDLCNFLLIYLHNKQLSEEIALDIFTYIWEKRRSLQIRATFKSFLFAAAKNKAISLYHKERKQMFSMVNTADTLDLSDGSDIETILDNNDLRKIIASAIQNLPEKNRQIYQLAWEENLSYKTIAEQLNISPKTVENQVGIALRKLRLSLKPYYKQIFIWWAILYLFN